MVEMTPSLASNDVRDVVGRDAVGVGDQSPSLSTSNPEPYGDDVGQRQPRGRVRLAEQCVRSATPVAVLGVALDGADVEVVRSDAKRHVTVVADVDVWPIGDGSVRQHPRQAMRWPHGVLVEDSAVAVAHDVRRPEPATSGLVHPGPEDFGGIPMVRHWPIVSCDVRGCK